MNNDDLSLEQWAADEAEQNAQYAKNCTCGAWRFNWCGEGVKFFDCECGAEKSPDD